MVQKLEKLDRGGDCQDCRMPESFNAANVNPMYPMLKIKIAGLKMYIESLVRLQENDPEYDFESGKDHLELVNYLCADIFADRA